MRGHRRLDADRSSAEQNVWIDRGDASAARSRRYRIYRIHRARCGSTFACAIDYSCLQGIPGETRNVLAVACKRAKLEFLKGMFGSKDRKRLIKKGLACNKQRRKSTQKEWMRKLDTNPWVKTGMFVAFVLVLASSDIFSRTPGTCQIFPDWFPGVHHSGGPTLDQFSGDISQEFSGCFGFRGRCSSTCASPS